MKESWPQLTSWPMPHLRPMLRADPKCPEHGASELRPKPHLVRFGVDGQNPLLIRCFFFCSVRLGMDIVHQGGGDVDLDGQFGPNRKSMCVLSCHSNALLSDSGERL